LKTDNVESLADDLDLRRWDREIPAFFAFDRDGHPRRTLVGNLSRGDFDRLVSDLLAPEKR
jgi:hypothetical protein